ncbi:zinc-binding dehydrogenase [Paraburkholderia sp. BCC1885]|uniref:zinc-binding dehydrogenase n=1 Tax=Paraburkholderia sp. BCC1885 TaxID=2562669 RepID=UPI00391F100D
MGSRARFEAMNRCIELRKLRPVVDQVFTLETVVDAFKHMESGAHFGKVVEKI